MSMWSQRGESICMFQGQREGLLIPKGEKFGEAWRGGALEISLHIPGMGLMQT